MSNRLGILLVVIVMTVVGGIAGVGIYNERLAPYRTVVVRVDDDREVRMDYFVKRMAASGMQSRQLLNVLSREEIILKVAPNPPYNIKLSDDDVVAFVRSQATGGQDSITDAEYDEWFRQQLNNSEFTEVEFLDLARRNLTAQRLNEYLGLQIETVAEQVHLQVIVVPDLAAARLVADRLDNGELFSVLARELNRGELQESGGDWGWFPRTGLPAGLRHLVFEQLGKEQRSDPVPLPQPSGDSVFAIVRIADRAAAREVSGLALEAARAQALDQWYAKERPLHEVAFFGFNNGYDAETEAWVLWQIQRRKRQ